MRTVICRFALLCSFLTSLAAAGTAETMKTLIGRSDRAICAALRPKAKDCGTVIESATQNALAGGDNLWGFSYSIRNQGIQSAKDAEAMKTALRALGAGVLMQRLWRREVGAAGRLEHEIEVAVRVGQAGHRRVHRPALDHHQLGRQRGEGALALQHDIGDRPGERDLGEAREHSPQHSRRGASRALGGAALRCPAR